MTLRDRMLQRTMRSKIARGLTTKYSDDEPRDDHGRWSAGSGSSDGKIATMPINKDSLEQNSSYHGINVTWHGTLQDGTKVFLKPLGFPNYAGSDGEQAGIHSVAAAVVAQHMDAISKGFIDTPPVSIRDMPNPRLNPPPGAPAGFRALVTQGAEGTPYLISQADVNQTDMNNISVFDSLIGNNDRNQGNLLVTDTGHVIAIDHDNTFDPKYGPSSGGDWGHPSSYSDQQQGVLDGLAKDTSLRSDLGHTGLSTPEIDGFYKRLNSATRK